MANLADEDWAALKRLFFSIVGNKWRRDWKRSQVYNDENHLVVMVSNHPVGDNNNIYWWIENGYLNIETHAMWYVYEPHQFSLGDPWLMRKSRRLFRKILKSLFDRIKENQ